MKEDEVKTRKSLLLKMTCTLVHTYLAITVKLFVVGLLSRSAKTKAELISS